MCACVCECACACAYVCECECECVCKCNERKKYDWYYVERDFMPEASIYNNFFRKSKPCKYLN